MVGIHVERFLDVGFRSSNCSSPCEVEKSVKEKASPYVAKSECRGVVLGAGSVKSGAQKYSVVERAGKAYRSE